MSKTIDEKVVQLKFDNSNFEKNVNTSMSTLEKFQNALKFEGASKGLDDIEKAAKKCDVSPVEKQVHSLELSFKALDVVAVTALQNITNKAVDFGLKIARQVSGIDNIRIGWNKMDQMTGSVQTLVNSTGKSVDEITEKLNRLMIFGDETSFSFTDMTSALSTMVASGGDIDKLIPMIEGMANATAYAGKSSAEFSRVIYNLNQSYSAGHLMYQDWKSVQLAGVNSKALMETLIGTAEELGKIEKGTITVGNFTETLKQKWADTEVMEVAFGKFSKMTQAAYELVEVEGKFGSYTQAYKHLKEQSDVFDEIAIRAALSAQEAKTFKEAVDATAEAYQSKWLTIFSKMFGNYDEAKVLWTNVVEDLYTIFVEPIDNFSNNIISPVFESRWQEFSSIIEETGMSIETFEKELIEYGNKNGKNISELIIKYGSLKAALSSGEIGKNFIIDFIKSLAKGEQAVENITDKVVKFQEIYDKIWSGEFGNGEERFKKLTEAGYDYNQIQGLINDMAKKGHREGYKLTVEDLNDLTDAQLEAIGYTEETVKSLREMASQLEDTNTPLEELIENITKPSGRELLAGTITNLLAIFKNLQASAHDAWESVGGAEFASSILYTSLHSLFTFTESIKRLTSESNLLTNVLKVVYSIITLVGKAFGIVREVIGQIATFGFNLLSKIFSSINVDFTNFTNAIGNGLDKVREWISENNIIIETLENIAEKIKNVIKFVKEWVKSNIDLEKLQTMFESFKKSFSDFKIGDLKQGIKPLKDLMEDIKSGKINPMEALFENIGKYFGNIVGILDQTKTKVVTTLTQIKNPIKLSEDEIKGITNTLGRFVETLIGIGAGYMVLGGLKKMADSFAVLVKPVYALSNLLQSFSYFGDALTLYVKDLRANIKTSNLLKLALAISLLFGALYLLAKLDKDALWNAVGAVAALAAVIAGLTVAVNYASGLGGESEGLKKISMFLIALAGALLIMSIALKKIDGLKNGLESAIIAVGLMAALVVAVNKLTPNLKDVSKSGWLLISFGVSLYILAMALKKLASIEYKNFGQTVLALGFSVAALVALSYAMKGLNKGATVSVLALSASMYLLAKSFEKFGKIDGEVYYKGLLTMVPIIGVMALILKAASKASANIGSAGAFAIGVAGSVYLIARAIEKFGNMDGKVLLKGGITATILMGVVGVMAAALSAMSKSFGTIRQAVSMALVAVTLAGVLYLMAGAIMIFKNMDEAGLKKAVKTIVVLELAFGAMMFLMNNKWTRGYDYNGIKALAGIAVILAVLAGSILVLSFIDTSKLLSTVGSMVAVMVSLSILIGTMSLMKNNSSILMSMLAIVGILGAVSGAIYFLTNNIKDIDKAVAISESLSTFIIKLAASMVLISVAGAISSAAAAGAGSLVTIVGILGMIGAIMMALGYIIDIIPGSMGAMDTAIQFLTKIGEGIGGFIGGFVGAIAGSALDVFTTYIPEVAKSLSDFAENIKPFLELTFPSEFETTISDLSQMVITFGSPSFIEGMKNLVDNKKTAKKIGEFFSTYADAVIGFSDKIKGKISTSSVESASAAGLMMAEVAKSLPSTGGLFQVITGEKDLGEFATDMVSFAEALTEMSTKLSGFDMSSAEAAKSAGLMMAELANSIPNEGGLWGLLAGEKDLGTFGTQLTGFAGGLSEMSQILTGDPGFNSESVEIAKKAGLTMTELANAIPESTSLKSLLFGGEKSLGDFGANIINFASGLASLSTILTSDPGFDENTPEIARKAGETMASIANAIPESGGWFTSGKDLGSFGKSLIGFAQGLVDFSNIIGQLDSSTFPTGEEIEQYTYILGKDFITNFGEGIGDTTTISSITSSITELMNTIIEKMNKKGEAETVGLNILNGLYNGLSNSSWINKLYNQVDTLSNSITNKMKKTFDIQSPSKVTEEIGKFVGMGLINGLSSMQDKVGTKAENVALLMSESLSSAINLANSILDEDLNPVITPVLDLSNVEGTAGSISDLMVANASLNGALAINSQYGQNQINQNGEKQVNVSVNFTVNNAGRDLSDADVKRFGRQIANEVNEVLGGMVA